MNVGVPRESVPYEKRVALVPDAIKKLVAAGLGVVVEAGAGFGAGVAGLQAIATTKRLGAVVSAFDVRPAVKEQVESLGAKFIDIELQAKDTETAGGYAKELSEDSSRKVRELLHETLRGMDAVITTALVPDRPAPRLITEDMVKDMRPGSVDVDMAAEAGGN